MYRILLTALVIGVVTMAEHRFAPAEKTETVFGHYLPQPPKKKSKKRLFRP